MNFNLKEANIHKILNNFKKKLSENNVSKANYKKLNPNNIRLNKITPKQIIIPNSNITSIKPFQNCIQKNIFNYLRKNITETNSVVYENIVNNTEDLESNKAYKNNNTNTKKNINIPNKLNYNIKVNKVSFVNNNKLKQNNKCNKSSIYAHKRNEKKKYIKL